MSIKRELNATSDECWIQHSYLPLIAGVFIAVMRKKANVI